MRAPKARARKFLHITIGKVAFSLMKYDELIHASAEGASQKIQSKLAIPFIFPSFALFPPFLPSIFPPFLEFFLLFFLSFLVFFLPFLLYFLTEHEIFGEPQARQKFPGVPDTRTPHFFHVRSALIQILCLQLELTSRKGC